MKGGISYMPRKQFTVKCSSSDTVQISSPWNEIYEPATRSSFYRAGYDLDYMKRPDVLDQYDDLEYVGWAIGKDENLCELLDDYAGIGAVCLVKDSSGNIVPIEISGGRVHDLDFDKIVSAID